ncbi:MAG TPA: ATP-binding protein [Methanosarcina sp.]|nr:ATP-binding protein [Methanosarcina sp.]
MAKFKARARTIDMLGRQQIAGIPTAISELFKNAHDAYADHVEVDYFRSDGLFVLRDDGLGMTNKEFEDRWLTLGTESKLGYKRGLTLPPRDPEKPDRPIMGEKGIGRLAIASIGPQVLVLTRAKRNEKLHDLVVAFINWSLFELPGIDLDQIEVPIRTFKNGEVPTESDISKMVDEVLHNIENLEETGSISDEDSVKLNEQLRNFSLDLHQIYNFLGGLSISGMGHGTHFFVLPSDDILKSLIDDEKDDSAPALKKTLLGFTNTMDTELTTSKIKVCFRDHKTDEYFDDIIAEDKFFTPDEFSMADHHIQGSFDEYGTFKGTVIVYGEKITEHVINWNNRKDMKTLCGPFKINVGYVHAEVNSTKIPPEEHAKLIPKLTKIGGLYIYRDGIRILPYGGTDYDFLGMENRRSRSASYYFFTFRRMLGYIEISRKDNSNLIEKAGREGFRENKAYSQFKDILTNFFIQLAADFFRKGGEKSEYWFDRKAELNRLDEARKKKEEQDKLKRNKLEKDIDEFFKKADVNALNEEVNSILEAEKQRIKSSLNGNFENSGPKILEIESIARKRLQNLRSKLNVQRPRGIALGKNVEKGWEAHYNEVQRLDQEIFIPAAKKIEKISQTFIKNHEEQTKVKVVDEHERLNRFFKDSCKNSRDSITLEASDTKKVLNNTSNEIINLIQKITTEMNNLEKQILTDFSQNNVSKMSESELFLKRNEVDKLLSQATENKLRILENIKNQLKNITWEYDKTGNIITSVDMAEATEEELMALRDKVNLDLELIQLGMAVGVIHHEFGGTVKSIRENIRRLKSWADLNEDLQPLYQNLRANFEHLDGYLTLFTPLNRRLYRKEIEINGVVIKTFLEDVFDERLKRHEIELEFTSSFIEKTIIGYPSTFYPVFVNILDNAIFWLKDNSIPRNLVLDADDNGYFISNNGPEISKKDYENIFEFRFSRKPGGRGLGLYISKEVLLKVGYDIYVTDPQLGNGVTFRIEQNQNEINEVK